VIVYDKAKNYRLFEFVWNPSKDLANALNQAGVQTGPPKPVAPATAPPQTPGGSNQNNQNNPPPAEMPLPSPPPNPEEPPN
jgi:hypothetical protein